jgi:hypothetical protein
MGSAGTTLTTHHSLIRMMDGMLVVTNCTFDFVMSIEPGHDKALQSSLIGNMKKWLDEVFDGSIVLPMNRGFDPVAFAGIKNNLVFSPDDPYDIVMQVLVHAKLTAIGKGLVGIERSHVATDTSNGFGTWFDGDPNELLPSQAEWMGDRCYFPLPWWHRSDGSTIDIIASDGDNLEDKPDILIDLDSLDLDGNDDGNRGSAEIIRPDFKPRIVTDD